MSGTRSCSGAHSGNELTARTNMSIEMTLLIITLGFVLLVCITYFKPVIPKVGGISIPGGGEKSDQPEGSNGT